jgi:hypothetical protein
MLLCMDVPMLRLFSVLLVRYEFIHPFISCSYGYIVTCFSIFHVVNIFLCRKGLICFQYSEMDLLFVSTPNCE